MFTTEAISIRKPNIRGIVLHACASALATSANRSRMRPEQQVDAIAQTLVQLNIPIVIAMQADLPEDVAQDFTERFYQHVFYALAHSPAPAEMFENALCAARVALARGRPQDYPAWGIPVLYCNGVPEASVQFKEDPQEEARRERLANRQARLDWLQDSESRLRDNLDQEWARREWQE